MALHKYLHATKRGASRRVHLTLFRAHIRQMVVVDFCRTTSERKLNSQWLNGSLFGLKVMLWNKLTNSGGLISVKLFIFFPFDFTSFDCFVADDRKSYSCRKVAESIINCVASFTYLTKLLEPRWLQIQQLIQLMIVPTTQLFKLEPNRVRSLHFISSHVKSLLIASEFLFHFNSHVSCSIIKS